MVYNQRWVDNKNVHYNTFLIILTPLLLFYYYKVTEIVFLRKIYYFVLKYSKTQ